MPIAALGYQSETLASSAAIIVTNTYMAGIRFSGSACPSPLTPIDLLG
jgi:hypothetical protein